MTPEQQESVGLDAIEENTNQLTIVVDSGVDSFQSDDLWNTSDDVSDLTAQRPEGSYQPAFGQTNKITKNLPLAIFELLCAFGSLLLNITKLSNAGGNDGYESSSDEDDSDSSDDRLNYSPTSYFKKAANWLCAFGSLLLNITKLSNAVDDDGYESPSDEDYELNEEQSNTADESKNKAQSDDKADERSEIVDPATLLLQAQKYLDNGQNAEARAIYLQQVQHAVNLQKKNAELQQKLEWFRSGCNGNRQFNRKGSQSKNE